MRGSRAAGTAALVGWLGAGAPALHAGNWELGLFAGQSIPTYEQTFTYSPGRFHSPEPLPGLSVLEEGSFGLTAKGGLAAGGSLTFFPAEFFGLEARLDTVGVRVDSTGLRYTVHFQSSLVPIPPFTGSLDLPPLEGEVDRVTPISLGVKLRTPGRARFFISAGASYLPKLGATATQSLAVQLTRFSPPIEAARLSIRAEAQPGEGQSRWGATAGAGVEVALGGSVSLVGEGRVFRYQEQTLHWTLVGPAALTPIERELQDAALKGLDPVEFKPTFYQVTGGLAVRF